MDHPLTRLHAQQQITLVEVQGASWPLQFGADPLAEYQAAHTGVTVSDGTALGVLELTGADRATFLHGLVTNDIKRLPVDHACWACLLTPKSKVEALCLIVHRPDAHWALAPRALLASISATCATYLIMEDVQIRDRSDAWTVLGLQGPTSAALLAALAHTTVPLTTQRWCDITVDGVSVGVLGHDPLGVPGALCVVPTEHTVTVWGRCLAAGAQPLGLLALQMLRVEAGWPWYGVDVDATHLLPETGWERSATSYTKGCYVGQEIVARAATQGRMARHLVGLQLTASALPTTPCHVLLNGSSCGTLTSVAYSPQRQAMLGLAMVARAAWAPGAVLTLEQHPDIVAHLVPLPHLPLPA